MQDSSSSNDLHDLTILLPCLNEAETLEICIRKASVFLKTSGIKGEILISDNGSTDGSQSIAQRLGVRIVHSPIQGYGAALIFGIAHINSKYTVMGDADDSYALDDLGFFIDSLKSGNDLVVGNRFLGGISPGAMPWLHKYIGNPILSALGKKFFKIPINDFHCGLRAFRTESIKKLNLKSIGMEFASEMIVRASLAKLKIAEVPTTLSKDGRSRKPHLRTWRDGYRHLIFLLIAAPKWIFLYPGFFISLSSLLGLTLLANGPYRANNFEFSINTYLILIGLLLAGIQIFSFGILTEALSLFYGMNTKSKLFKRFYSFFSLEKGIVFGIFLIFLAIVLFYSLVSRWDGSSISNLTIENSVRISGFIVLILNLGIQLIFASFFMSVIRDKLK